MFYPFEVAECINEACHGGTFDDIGQAENYETGPTKPVEGVDDVFFELDLGSNGKFKITVEQI